MIKQESAASERVFFTPEQFVQEQSRRIESPRGRLLVASCRSGAGIAAEIVGHYKALLEQAGSESDVAYLESVDFQFSDRETCVRLGLDVSGDDVFLCQSLFDPTSDRSVDQNYMAFFIAARALREWGANHITAVLPYLAYARQDKPTRFKREPTTVKLLADFSAQTGVDRVVTWHPHSRQVQGFYGNLPVTVLDPLWLFVEEFQRFGGRDDVIAVAPDTGATKLLTHFGRTLNLVVAVASKQRPHPEEAVVTEMMGDFRGKRVAIILDDMMSSGGTVAALIEKLVNEKGIEEVYLGVSHNLCMERARQHLLELHADYHLKEVMVTNSIPQTDAFKMLPFISVRDLSEPLSRVINRIHYNRPVSDLFYEALPNVASDDEEIS